MEIQNIVTVLVFRDNDILEYVISVPVYLVNVPAVGQIKGFWFNNSSFVKLK